MTFSKLGNNRCFIFFALLLLSVIIHFYHLDHPEKVVFDEVHFGSYVDAYCCSGERFFDIHPPHAKLLISGVAKILGYQGGQDFKLINTYFPGSDAIAMRFVPAFCGTFLVVVIFLLVLELGGATATALFVSLLILFDNAFVVQSRLISLDMVLLLSTFLSFLLVLLANKARIEQQHTKKSLSLFFLAGLLSALAVGSKFTGLISVFLPFAIALIDCVKHLSWQNIKSWLLAALVFVIAFSFLYLSGWYLHFQLLDQPGPGDIWGILNAPFFEKLISIHQTMLSANANLTATHPDMSLWWSWPWMHSPLFYWVDNGKVIYMMGNPLIWWSNTLFLITFSLMALMLKVSSLQLPVLEHNNTPRYGLIFVAYLVSFVPLILVSRALFLYHYFTPFIFSLMFVCLWLQRIGWLQEKSIFQQRYSVYIVLLFVVASFYFILPISYGLVDSSLRGDMIFSVFPTWR